MRVAIDLFPLARNLSGIGVYVKELLREMLRRDDCGCNWHFPLSASRNWHQMLRTQIAHHLSPHDRQIVIDYRWRPLAEGAYLYFPQRLRSPAGAPYDLFHLTHPQARFRPDRSIPWVVTVHDLAWLRLPADVYPKPKLIGLDRLTSVIEAAQVVLCDSLATLEDVADFTRVSRDRLVHAPLAGRTQFHAPAHPEMHDQQRQRFAGDQRYFLAISTIEPRKNYPRLIEAFAQVHRRHPQFRLMIAGQRGSDWPAVESKLSETGMRPHVQFLGFVDDDMLRERLWGADALIMPSLYEGFGLPVLEAMACGTPVLAADAGSLPEVAGTAGILVDPLNTDSIAAGLSKIAERNGNLHDYRTAGLQQAARFTWARTAEITLEAYRRAISA